MARRCSLRSTQFRRAAPPASGILVCFQRNCLYPLDGMTGRASTTNGAVLPWKTQFPGRVLCNVVDIMTSTTMRPSLSGSRSSFRGNVGAFLLPVVWKGTALERWSIRANHDTVSHLHEFGYWYLFGCWHDLMQATPSWPMPVPVINTMPSSSSGHINTWPSRTHKGPSTFSSLRPEYMFGQGCTKLA